MNKPSILISTVGTSLFANIARGGDTALQEAYREKDWERIANLLQSLAPSDRACGAEINTIDLLKRGNERISADARLLFCVSDTEDGAGMGEVLRLYYKCTAGDIHRIEGMQDENPDRFRRVGLVNLVRAIGRIIRDAGGADYVAINATGGYKAQIAMAVLLGQALSVPVYYMHERFSAIISLPPMPVTLDYALLAEEAPLLTALEQDAQLPLPVDYAVDERLHALIEIAEIDGASYAALTPVGQIFLEGYHTRFPADRTLPPDASPDQRKPPSYRDNHHRPSGFEDYVQRVWSEGPYVKHCFSSDYSGQKGIAKRGFYIRPIKNQPEIVGDYKDGSGFGARFVLTTTATTEAQRIAVVMDLSERCCAL